jgi:hypothetical protein
MPDTVWRGRGRPNPKQPGIECIGAGCMVVTLEQPGAFPMLDGDVSRASWCLWCGGGVSNEYLGEDEDREPTPEEIDAAAEIAQNACAWPIGDRFYCEEPAVTEDHRCWKHTGEER